MICGRGVSWSSTDGGNTWGPAEFEPTIEYGWIYDVEPLAPGRFVACGDEGVVYRKAPGDHWKRINY